MNSIRDEFLSHLKQVACDAVGSYVVMNQGIQEHRQHANQYPNSTVTVGAGPPTQSDVRRVKYSPTHEQIQLKLSNNRELILELFLTEIIQHWFDFLANIYAKAVKNNIDGLSNYTIPVANLKVDFSYCGNEMINNILESAKNSFGFLPSKEKFNVVKKILDVDISEIQGELELLKTNIQVRNILQHQSGIVRDKDLANLGVDSIAEDHGNLVRNINSNQKITRTVFDIESLVDAFEKIANKVIN